MKRLLLSLCLVVVFIKSHAQESVSIGTDQIKGAAILWLEGNGSQGLLLPFANTSAFTPAANEEGLVVYDDATKKVMYWNGTAWSAVGGASAGQQLSKSGNQINLSGSVSIKIADTAPTQKGQILVWDGTAWTATTGAVPTDGQVLKWNGTTWAPSAESAGSTVTADGLTLQLVAGQLSLKNTAVSPGTYGSATQVPQIIVDQQGRITSAANVNITPGATTLDALTDATVTSPVSGQILVNNGSGQFQNRTVSGDITINSTGATTISADAITSAEITNGTIAAVDLNAMGATNGQVLKFNGTAWAPAADDAGTGSTPTLANGQILTGNGTANTATPLGGDATLNAGTLTISNNAIGSAEITDNSVASTDITDGTITTTDIASETITSANILNGTITGGDLNNMSATSGQVLKYNGTTWAPAADNAGTATPTLANGQILTGNGTTNAATTLSGDATLNNGVLTVSADAITTAEITNGTIAAADLSAMGASNGQVLKYNGTAWAPAADDTGGGTTPTLTNGQILTGNGTTNAATALTGDATLSGGTLTISSNAVGSAEITDNSIASADIADGTIAGADLSTMSATSGQVLKYNGTTWAPAADNTGTATPTLANGQILTGNGTTNAATTLSGDATLNNGVLTISADAISSSEIAPGTITSGDIASETITSGNIQNGTIAAADLSTMSATSGQVLKFNGTNWAPAADDAGVGATPTLSDGQILTGDGTNNAATLLAGDAALSGGSLTINTGAVTSAKILDNTISSADIADGTVSAADLNAMGASNGQVLQYNGSAWTPTTVTTGATTLDGLTDATLATVSSGQVLINDGAGQFRNRTLTGDAGVSSTGVVTISADAIGSAEITNGTITGTDLSSETVTSANILNATITGTDIANSTITSSNITDGTIAAADLSQMSAANGQVLKFNGTNWAPAADNTGTATPTLANGQILTGNGTTNAATTLTGDASLASGTLTIGNGVVTSAKIADGTITGTDIANNTVSSANITDASITGTDVADGTIDAADLASMSATSGQVLQYDGTNWSPASLATGVTTLDGLSDATVSTPAAGQVLINDGAGQFQNRSLSGDATISSTGVVTIASNAIGSSEITDGSIATADLANTAVTAGTYGNTTNVAQFTVDAKGRITGASNVALTTGATTLDGLTDATVSTPTAGQVLINDGAGQFQNRSLSGDATISSAGVVTIASNAIGSSEITDGSVANADLGTGSVNSTTISDGTVTTTDIADGTIEAVDLAGMSATAGQVLKYNGTSWAPGVDNTSGGGGGGGGAPVLADGQILIGDGSVNNPATLTGDATLTGGIVTITNNAIGSAEITDGAITSADIANGTIAAADLSTMSATNGQVLTFNGTAWAPATPTTGSTTIDGLSDATITTAASGQILVNDGAGQFRNRTMSGDATLDNAGALTIATDAVGSTEIANGSITGTDIAATTITAGNITDATITSTKLTTTGVTAGTYGNATNVSQFTVDAQGRITGASNVAIAAGATTLDGLTDATVNTPTTGQILINDGAGQFQNRSLSGDATINNTGTVTIANNAIGSAEITDGTVASADIANATITSTDIASETITSSNILNGTIAAADLSTMSATAGQVLQFNAGAWTPSTLTLGATTLDGLTDATVTTPASGQILINDGAGQFQNRSLSGDVVVNNLGVTSIVDGSVTNQKISGVGLGKLLQGSATAGQTLTWNGTAWTPTSVTAAASPAYYAVRGNSAGSAQEASSIFDDGGFTGIDLSGAITGSDRFSVNADNGAGAWGGMYVNANTTGLPFYGYAQGKAAVAYSYIDASGHWHLYNAGEHLTVLKDGKIGVNTVSPNNGILHLEGGTATYNGIHFTHSGSGTGGSDGFIVGPSTLNSNDLTLWNFESGAIRLGTNSAERMTVTSTGNVGIGITNPTAPLHLYGGAGGGGGSYSPYVRGAVEDNDQTFFEINGVGWSGFTFNDDAQSVRAGMFLNHTSDYLQFKTGGVDSRLVITEDGNVGVNTTAPLGLLGVTNSTSGSQPSALYVTNNYAGASSKFGSYIDVSADGTGGRYGNYVRTIAPAGTGTLATGMHSYVMHNGTGTTYGYYADVNKAASQSGNLYGLYVVSDNDGTGSSYLMYANSIGSTTGTEYGVYVTGEDQNYFSGDIGIGTATPETELHIKHVNGYPNHGIKITDTFNDADVDLYVSATDGALWLGFNNAHLGTFNATTGAYTTVSDRRMKRDIEPVGGILDKVLKLNPVQYYFTTEKNPKNKNFGFIAQDVQSIFPSLVNYSQEDDRYSLDYTGFGVLAIKALQEQNEVINEQKSEIEKLKGELDTLKGQVEEIKKLLEKK